MPLLRSLTIKVKNKFTSSSAQPPLPPPFEISSRTKLQLEAHKNLQPNRSFAVTSRKSTLDSLSELPKRVESFSSDEATTVSTGSISEPTSAVDVKKERRRSKFREEFGDMTAEVS